MNALRNRPLLLLLASLAWLAQLALPVAHAASMAQAGGGIAVWCGDGDAVSPALRARLAELPVELRELLLPPASDAHAGDCCAAHCGGATSPVPPPAPAVAQRLRQAGLEPVAPEPVIAPRTPCASPLPARGPPHRS